MAKRCCGGSPKPVLARKTPRPNDDPRTTMQWCVTLPSGDESCFAVRREGKELAKKLGIAGPRAKQIPK